MSIKKEYNVHHLIPSSKGGLTTERNLVKIPVKEHAKLHAYFGNGTPIEQICQVLLLNEKIWTDNFRADLMAVLDNYINNYYNPKAHQGVIKSEVKKVLSLEK